MTLQRRGLCRRLAMGVVAVVIAGALPLVGVWMNGGPVGAYLRFPPRTQLVTHAPFSWGVFLGIAILGVVLFLAVGVSLFTSRLPSTKRDQAAFPWWGWGGIVLTGVSWLMAWTRFEWFAPFQVLVFTPLWLGYIIVVNAWTVRRTGCCLMTERPRLFLWLFPLSAFFWWLFEYLNRFSQNWYYPPVLELRPLTYFVVATLPFSTVLPAVLSTARLLKSFRQFDDGALHGPQLRVRRGPRWALVALVLAGAGLVGLGVWPDLLFPLLWVSPLVLVLGLAVLCGQTTVLRGVAVGDWTLPVRYALAALVCGVFWEFWNAGAAAKWVYSVPYVHRFLIFEMPLLGYLGYLPFGLECIAIVDFVCGGRGATESKS